MSQSDRQRRRPSSSIIESNAAGRPVSGLLPPGSQTGRTPGTAVISRAAPERERRVESHPLLHPVLVAAMVFTLVFPFAAWLGVYNFKHQRRSSLRSDQMDVDAHLQRVESALSEASLTALRNDESVVAASATALDKVYCRDEQDAYSALERSLTIGVLSLGNYRRGAGAAAPTVDPAQVTVQPGAYRVVDASLDRVSGGPVFETAAEAHFVVVGDFVGCSAFLLDLERFIERHFRYLDVVLPYARDDSRGVYSMLVHIHVPVLTGTLDDARLDALLDR